MSYVSLGQERVASATMTAREQLVAPSLVTFAPILTKQSPSCITAAEKAQAALDCKIPDIKGLGFTYGPQSTRFAGMDACAVARLPLCPTPSLAPSRASTVTASSFTPTATTSVLQPLPRDAVKLPTAPTFVPPPPAPEPDKKFGLGVGGILLLLAVVGGGTYMVMRKKKGKAT